MTTPARVRLLVLLLTAMCLAGCEPKRPQVRVSMDHLVAEYNANARRVPRLWARVKMQLSVKDENGRTLLTWGSTSPLARPNGLLLLFKADDPFRPQNFVLIGRETAAMDVFRIGSSVDEGIYYLWYGYGERRKAWWGWHKYVGAAAVTMPFDPNQLLAVLAVCLLPEDFTRLPTVTMRMSQRPFAYVLTYLDRQPITGRIGSRREVYFRWDDKRPRRPFLIHIFDSTGQQVMTARLKKYRPIEAADAPELRPVMPTDVEITWPATGSRLHMVLSEMTAQEDRGDVEACRFRDAETNDLPGGLTAADLVQVDATLETGGDQE